MSRTILIKSQDRNTGGSNTSSNFYIQSRDVLEGLYEVKHILIPNTTYNIHDNNSEITLHETAPVGSYLIGIYPGSYTGAQLAAVLQTAFNGVGVQPFTVSLNQITGKLVILCTTFQSFSISFPNIHCSRTYGFGEALQTQTAAGIASTHVINLSHPDSLGVQIKQLHCSTTAYENIVTRSSGALYVPFNATFGYFVALPSQQLYQTVHFHRSTGLNISIVDTSTNQILDLNGGEWELLLSKVENDSTYHQQHDNKLIM